MTRAPMQSESVASFMRLVDAACSILDGMSASGDIDLLADPDMAEAWLTAELGLMIAGIAFGHIGRLRGLPPDLLHQLVSRRRPRVVCAVGAMGEAVERVASIAAKVGRDAHVALTAPMPRDVQ